MLTAGATEEQIREALAPRYARTTIGLYLKRGRQKLGIRTQRIKKPPELPKVLSKVHRRVGIKITLFRNSLGLSTAGFSEDYNFANRRSLSTMEAGLHDFTLQELLKLAEIMEIDLETLLQPTAST